MQRNSGVYQIVDRLLFFFRFTFSNAMFLALCLVLFNIYQWPQNAIESGEGHCGLWPGKKIVYFLKAPNTLQQIVLHFNLIRAVAFGFLFLLLPSTTPAPATVPTQFRVAKGAANVNSTTRIICIWHMFVIVTPLYMLHLYIFVHF